MPLVIHIFGFLSLLGIATCSFLVLRSRSEFKKQVFSIYFSGFLTIVFYICFLHAKTQFVAEIFDGIYFVMTDVLLYLFLVFALNFAEYKNVAKVARYLVGLIVLVDAFFLIGNAFTHHAFTLSPAFDERIGIDYWSLNIEDGLPIHLSFDYTMAALLFISVLIKCFRTPYGYKLKYVRLVGCFTVLLAVNAFCYLSDLSIDYSIFMYPVLAFYTVYYLTYSAQDKIVKHALRNVQFSNRDGIICFDSENELVYSNPKAKEIFDASKEKLAEKVIQLKKNHFSDKKFENLTVEYEKWTEEIITNNNTRTYEIEYQTLNSNKNYIGNFLRFKDITPQLENLKRERYLANHDSLTGIYNRTKFFEEVEKKLKESGDKDWILICSNIKDFKLINQLYGRESGDRVLISQARQIEKMSHPENVYGRINADNFAVLMRKENFIADEVYKGMRSVGNLAEDSIYEIQVNVGVYEIHDNNENPQLIYDKARMALDEINDVYQKTFNSYSSDIYEKIVYRQKLIHDFEKQLKKGAISIYLQPILDEKNELIGAEALSRWNHKEFGLIHPHQFINILEQTGLIYKLDNYVWEETIKMISRWKEEKRKLVQVSINVSRKDFYYIDVCKTLLMLCDKYQVETSLLKLQLIEETVVSDFIKMKIAIEKLKIYGFSVELDSFGVGYSSLNMLKDISVNGVKISMELIQQAENNQKNKIILESIVKMVNNLEMTVFAEGIEAEEHLNYVKKIGVQGFQGFYFSEAIPVDDFQKKYLS